jgi:hypothetical protein
VRIARLASISAEMLNATPIETRRVLNARKAKTATTTPTSSTKKLGKFIVIYTQMETSTAVLPSICIVPTKREPQMAGPARDQPIETELSVNNVPKACIKTKPVIDLKCANLKPITSVLQASKQAFPVAAIPENVTTARLANFNQIPILIAQIGPMSLGSTVYLRMTTGYILMTM